MKDEHQKHLEDQAMGLDRAIVRLGMKEPYALNREDVAFVVMAMAGARDALRWAAKR